MTCDNVDGVDEKFDAFRESLKGYFGPAVYDSWFSTIALDAYGDGEAVLSLQSGAQAERVNQQHRTPVRTLFCKEFGPVRKFSVIARRSMSKSLSGSAQKAALRANGLVAAQTDSAVRRSLAGFEFATPAPASTGRAAPTAPVLPLSVDAMASALDPQCTFENFAEDATNERALVFAREIFRDAGASLIYIYGESGVGKSHLLQAIGHEWARRFPEKPFVYVKHANLRDGCKAAVRSGNIYAMTRDFMTRELAMFDDIHRLEQARRTLEELSNLIDGFVAEGRQIIIVGDKSPGELAEAGFDRRLTDRLAGGLTAEIRQGGEDLRVKVLKKRRAVSPPACDIADEAIDYIAHNFPASMREAIGMYTQLTLVHGDKPVRVGAAEARAALQSHVRPARPAAASLADALEAAASVFGLTVADLTGRAQPQRIVRARHAFVMVGREQMNESFPRLSKALGRDHTTAMSGYDRATALHEREESFREKVRQIRDRLGL